MTYTQKHNELIQLVAAALRNSGRTCDEDSWPEVMALEAVNAIAKYYAGLENGPDKYHRHHEIHEGNCITCYRQGDKVITEDKS